MKQLLEKIKFMGFPADQYVPEETEKTQIVLHHTVSGPGVAGDINWWLSTKERIATHIIIARNGDIYQGYSTRFWGYHVGLKQKDLDKIIKGYNWEDLNSRSIAVELDSWGPLREKNGKFYPVKKMGKGWTADTSLNPVEDIVEIPKYRGFTHYERYTALQLMSLKELLDYWNAKWGISLAYDEQMWDVSARAIKGEIGVVSHTSFRKDKSDVAPQPNLIHVLKGGML